MLDHVKCKNLEIILACDFKSYFLDMLLFKLDIKWDYVNKIQLLNFYLYIHDCRI